MPFNNEAVVTFYFRQQDLVLFAACNEHLLKEIVAAIAHKDTDQIPVLREGLSERGCPKSIE